MNTYPRSYLFFILILLLASIIYSIEKAYGLDLKEPIDSYFISSDCGYRTNPMGGIEFKLHKGIDIVGKYKCEVKSATDGIVVEHFPPPNGHYAGHPIYGGMIVIKVQKGIFILYGHFSKTFVLEGDIIKKGDVIGLQGNTGISTGDHLHFEIIISPIYFMDYKSILEIRRNK